jgi:hypothetical protein
MPEPVRTMTFFAPVAVLVTADQGVLGVGDVDDDTVRHEGGVDGRAGHVGEVAVGDEAGVADCGARHGRSS